MSLPKCTRSSTAVMAAGGFHGGTDRASRYVLLPFVFDLYHTVLLTYEAASIMFLICYALTLLLRRQHIE